ncbi:MAG: precorrin-3B C(17)-methyltransferase, partial [Mangrovicoccus sp.]
MSKPSMPPVIVSLTRSGAEIAERAAEALSDSHVFGCAHHQKGRDFTSTPDHLAMLFLAGHPIIAVCAAGIVIRALAPHL